MTWADWAVAAAGFGFITYATLRAPGIRDRNMRRARAARQWLANRERGDK